jgi:regulator of sigma E protease
MTTVVGAIGALILLSIMLLIHEAGHFVAAKRSGIVVEEFGFGYPPRLATLFRRGGTEYTLNAIPFGGFVRMKGEDDPEGPGSFVNASKRKRVTVLLAGAAMNLLLAVAMFTAAFVVGYPVLQQGAGVTRVLEHTAAAEAGLQANDIIMQIDDHVLRDWTDLAPYVKGRPNELIELVVRREGELLFLKARPQSVDGQGHLGIEFKPAVSLRRFPLHQALVQGVKVTGQFLWLTLSLPVMLLRGSVSWPAARHSMFWPAAGGLPSWS